MITTLIFGIKLPGMEDTIYINYTFTSSTKTRFRLDNFSEQIGLYSLWCIQNIFG